MSAARRTRRGSLVFPLVLVAVGVILLLVNLGIVSSGIWSQLLRLWPVLLIALGIDLVFGRPSLGSALATLIGTAVLLALAFSAIYLFGPETWITDRQTVAVPLGTATSAEIDLRCDGCAITVAGAAAAETLVEGTVTIRKDERLAQVDRRTDDAVHFELTGDPFLPTFHTASREERPWTVRLHPEIPIDLAVSTDRTIDLDLRGLRIQSVDLDGGAAPCRVVLPDTGRTTLHVQAEDLTVHVPDGVGLRLIGTPSGTLDVPEDYILSAADWLSPDYDEAATTVDLYLRPGVGDVEIVSLVSPPDPA